ncbi:cob(I)yrinic acid a,c-diamide adenosyltransferase [Crenobacter sp. SG2303]|uniref:Cobalamin adenosyltransferase n=1 Tax=Crenobacter oryzisoli TaxID=3056844 RepID=A0ABT7XS53_9NEIS|nr:MULTISPECIES: cob(I)yrinic acid a,c-diamide adenosyltransferase [unclassified Crenobacter]MDN0076565.1 cob(I)yrinic acid a,c-diamide adenosyltransferase [Crenobacter sp. SG2303]MDN0084565.1 cob(I)yrinic acid a,c-diamide adenosyltransferase [Crenobacter sp. SG2305]
MGHRLSRIVTRTGDDGTTGLGDGSRVEKDSARIGALGEVDELNSVLGLLLTEPLPQEIADWLAEVQHDLFDLGSELAVPGYSALAEVHVLALEAQIGKLNADLPMLKEFILPGGSRPAALAHQARSVCRRAERSVVSLARSEVVSDASRQYLNRLSDGLFVLARWLNRELGVPDVLWQPKRRPAESAEG